MNLYHLRNSPEGAGATTFIRSWHTGPGCFLLSVGSWMGGRRQPLTMADFLLPSEGTCVYLDIYFQSEEVNNLTAYFNVSEIPHSKKILKIEFNASCPLECHSGTSEGLECSAYTKARSKSCF